MKKTIISILVAALMLPHFSALAILKPTGPSTAPGGILNDYFENDRADVRTATILRGNIAFAANSDKAWIKDKQVTLTAKCYMDEYLNFYIPATAAKEYLGVTTNEEYIRHDKLKTLSGAAMYYDQLGLLIYSKDSSNIPKKVEWHTVCDAIGEVSWEYIDITPEEREAYIRNWQKVLTIPEGADRAEYEDYIASAIRAADTARENLYYGAGGEGPFSDVDIWSHEFRNTDEFLAALTTCYSRLESMARAYFIDGAKDAQRRDEILTALEFLYENHYSIELEESTSESWTQELFIVPYSYANIMCLMYDDMTDSDRVRHANAVFEHHPDPTTRRGSASPETYTNRQWRCYSYFNVAMMAGDTERMNFAMRYVYQAFMYTLSGVEGKEYDTDGFYEDGSMIFHKGHPYNLGYGSNYMIANSVQLLATKGSRFDIRNFSGWNVLYEFITTHLLPFIQENSMMRMVKGRHLPGGASSLMIHICVIMNNAPEPYKTQMAQAIRASIGDYWQSYREINTTADGYAASGAAIIYDFKQAVEFIDKISTQSTAAKSSKVYYNMDRVIHRMPNFTAALAMSSRRLYKLEAQDKVDNGYGWYIGDGMLYMYNGDGLQHSSSYTTDSNPYHMPGTTVDSTPRIDDWATSSAIDWGFPDNLWAGATTNGTTTMGTYEIGNKYVSSLKGKKSYFMLEDKVVCIGSGITAGNGKVYTTVENFMLSEKGQAPGMSELVVPIKSMTTSVEPGKIFTENESFDGDLSTSYGSKEYGVWFEYDLGEVTEASGLAIAFISGSKRQEIFRVEVSEDGQNYTTLLDTRSSGTTTKLQYFPAEFRARYVRLIGMHNTINLWFNFSEINVVKKGYTKERVEEILSTITVGYEDFHVGEELIETAFNKEFVFDDVKYAHLEGAGGYVFGDGSNISFTKETYQNSTMPFAAILLNHGIKPNNASYNYTLLPKATREETKAYAENPTVEILSATPKLHLAYDSESGIYGASVFHVGKVLDMTVKTPCTLILDTKNKMVHVSDPTHRFKEIKLTLPKSMRVKKTDGIKVSGNQVTIDISARKGATYSFGYSGLE